MIQENGLTLAYIGDAVYELKIREYLLSLGEQKVNDMHKNAIKYTCAKSQADFIDSYLINLSATEEEIYKRGRNSGGTHKPKNASLNDYRKATGFEALIGYLFLIKNEDRLNEIVTKSIEFLKEKNC